MPRPIEIKKGTTYGNLTFLEWIPNTYPRKALFRCACGNEKVINVQNVVHGITNSCGCLRFKYDKIQIGDMFGEWTVIKTGLSLKNGSKIVAACLCRCSCENKTERLVVNNNLLRGRSLSCGCLSKRFPKHYLKIGDRWTNRNGYVWVYHPEHPSSFKAKGNKGWLQEHRYVMEMYLGRILSPNEIVHHRNGNKADNRIENLELLNHSSHAKRHAIEAGKTGEKKKCIRCGKELNYTIGTKRKRLFCRSCYDEVRAEKHKPYPSDEDLFSLCIQLGYEAVGRQLGVSGNAIRRRLKKSPLGLPITKYTNNKMAE